jgi:CheY-like chemotaxis protein
MNRKSPPPLPAQPPCILVVDDDRETARAFQTALGPHVGLVTVPTAHAALELLRNGIAFDAICFELETPDSTGDAFFAEVCLIDEALGERVVVVARADAAAAWAAVAPLGRPSVAKPMDGAAIRAAIEHVRAAIKHGSDRADPVLLATSFGLDADALNVDDDADAEQVDDESYSHSPFGPFYPMPLQAAVTHAERLTNAVSDALDAILDSPAFDPNEPTEAEVWLVGRAEELELFVMEVVRDWRRGALRIEDAAEVLDRYIESIHRGLFENLGTERAPCCGAVDVTATGVIDHVAITQQFAPMNEATPTPNNC